MTKGIMAVLVLSVMASTSTFAATDAATERTGKTLATAKTDVQGMGGMAGNN